MGDIFHSADSSQRVNNQQQGVSTRDVGGSVATIGAGASNIHIQSMDPAALQVAAVAVHDALAANTATSVSAFSAYQRALEITGETSNNALQLAASGAGSGAVIAQPGQPQGGFNPSALIWTALAVAAAVAAIAYFRR